MSVYIFLSCIQYLGRGWFVIAIENNNISGAIVKGNSAGIYSARGGIAVLVRCSQWMLKYELVGAFYRYRRYCITVDIHKYSVFTATAWATSSDIYFIIVLLEVL